MTERKAATFQSLIEEAGKADLVNIAKVGMAESWEDMHDVHPGSHAHMQKQLRSTMIRLLPQSLSSDPYRARAEGIFSGLVFPDIVALCFEKDAFAFLLEVSCNEFLFYRNLRYVADYDWGADQNETMPFKLDYVRRRLVEERTPFGIPTSPFSTASIARLQALAAANGGKLDPNTLEAAYAFELIRLGLVLRCKLDDAYTVSPLVINPMWHPWLGKLGIEVVAPAASK
jgi:hypothetical protein